MKAYQLMIAAAAAGLLMATSPASATPLAPAAPAPLGLDRHGAVEPVHYRPYRSVRRHYRPHYQAPAVTFGLGPVVTPYYAYPYRHAYSPYYPTRYPYAYPYGYGFAPTFSFGFHVR